LTKQGAENDPAKQKSEAGQLEQLKKTIKLKEA
jgi:hypothetical protein